MKDKELKLNASGYYDEPCYQTIKTMDAPKPGEIWVHNVTGAYMLVLANENTTCATLRLMDVEKPGSISVMCKAQMYTNPLMVSYCFENLLTQYVKTVPAEEFAYIQQAVAKVLGIMNCCLVAPVPHDHINALEEKARALEVENKKLVIELEAREKAHILLNESFEKVSREADKAEIYKEMYTTLLDKVISARGEA